MRRRKVPILSIVLFVFSTLLAVYASWAFYQCYRDISEARDAGQLIFSGNEFEIAGFFMTNSLQYVIFAVLIFSAGWVAMRPQIITQALYASAPPTHAVRKDEDESLDEWFEELRKE